MNCYDIEKVGIIIKKISLLLLTILLLLVGCQKLDFEREGPFAVYTYYILGPDDYRNFYQTVISVYDDGQVLLTTKENDDLQIGPDAPRVETKVNREQIVELQQLIETNKLWQSEEDLSDYDSVDGASQYITIHLTDESKTIGGQNPNDESFLKVFNYIHHLIDPDEFSAWHDDIREYIYERNPD